MTKFDTVEFTVPNSYLSALINGDYSGLEESDIEEIETFVQDTVNKYGHAHFSGCKDVGMRTRNDINNLFSDCSEITLLIEL